MGTGGSRWPKRFPPTPERSDSPNQWFLLTLFTTILRQGGALPHV